MPSWLPSRFVFPVVLPVSSQLHVLKAFKLLSGSVPAFMPRTHLRLFTVSSQGVLNRVGLLLPHAICLLEGLEIRARVRCEAAEGSKKL